MNITEGELRKHADQRLKGLAALRRPQEPAAEETARFTLRRISPYLRSMGSERNEVQRAADGTVYNGSAANNRMFNATASRAHRTLKAGLSSGMSSPSQPWFKLKIERTDLMEVQAVKEWLDDVTNLLYAFFSQTNIYQALQHTYGELGWAGTGALLWVPHWQYGAVGFSTTFGECWLGQDDGLRVDTMLRDTSMTVAQMYERFPTDKLSDAVKRLHTAGKLDTMVPVRQMIEPNRERAFGKLDKTNMPYRSYYFDSKCDGEKVLEVGGFKRKPMATPRWEATGVDIYSDGPAFDALPESKKAQLQEVRLQQAMDYTVRPALEMSVANRNNGANLIPGGVTWSAAQDLQGQGTKAIWQVNPSALPAISQDITGRTEPAIEAAFFANLFMAITNMRGIQPRNIEEIAKRNEEQLAQLGPVVDRVQVELLSVVVMQTFEILADARRIPPVPEQLNGIELNIEFVSVLAQAQKMIGLGSMERALGFIGNIAGVYPAIVDKPDFEGMVDEYTSRLGIPARTMRSNEDVEAVRASRAQQEQMANTAAMAPALKDVAAGAELLSRTDANAGLLGRLAPSSGV